MFGATRVSPDCRTLVDNTPAFEPPLRHCDESLVCLRLGRHAGSEGHFPITVGEQGAKRGPPVQATVPRLTDHRHSAVWRQPEGASATSRPCLADYLTSRHDATCSHSRRHTGRYPAHLGAATQGATVFGATASMTEIVLSSRAWVFAPVYWKFQPYVRTSAWLSSQRRGGDDRRAGSPYPRPRGYGGVSPIAHPPLSGPPWPHGS